MKQSTKLNRVLEILKKIEGVSNKNAEKMAYSLLQLDASDRLELSDIIHHLDAYINVCPICNVYFEEDECPYCANEKRDHSIILLVNDYRVITQFEKTKKYHGLYHLVHDFVSLNTSEKTRFDDLTKLKNRLEKEKTQELVLGFDANMLGNYNTQYVIDFLKNTKVRITALARGIPNNGILEQYDLNTLEESLINRKAGSKE